MLNISCPVQYLAMPPLRQLLRTASLVHVPVSLCVATDVVRCGSQLLLQADHSIHCRLSDTNESSQLLCLLGPNGCPGAFEACRALCQTSSKCPWEVRDIVVRSFDLLLNLDRLLEALRGENGHHLAICHAELAAAISFMDSESSKYDTGDLNDALLTPLLEFLFNECGMPSTPYMGLCQWLDSCRTKTARFTAVDEVVQAHVLEYHGSTPDILSRAAADLYGRANVNGDSLFAVVHKLLRARGTDPAAPRPIGTPTGTLRSIDPSRGRARASGTFGVQATAGTSHVPWNTH